ncbi:hypothetical protein RJ640_004097 [Escallonia rubra]|uniref:ABC1 atypical kinase-like domain-containing protein n=1 Tax=Escallonia rubra TaxID=112253 RepID=A0AA88SFA2_9ASTE|nr:hypothetical protein RJ640_004097 [Escallonia rubra]
MSLTVVVGEAGICALKHQPYHYTLQDQDPSFPSETAVSIVEEELGAPVNDIFDWFDFEPITAASLGNLELILCQTF